MSRRQQKSQASETIIELPVTEAPTVQVASLKPPALYGQQFSLNVEAPEFEPRIHISADDRHEHHNKDHNRINVESKGDCNMTLPFVNSTTKDLKDILCDQITVENMKSKLAAAQSRARKCHCDIYYCFDLILAKEFSITIDEKLPVLMDIMISFYETVQCHTDDENLTIKNEITQSKNELNLKQQELSEPQSKISEFSTSIQGMNNFWLYMKTNIYQL